MGADGGYVAVYAGICGRVGGGGGWGGCVAEVCLGLIRTLKHITRRPPAQQAGIVFDTSLLDFVEGGGGGGGAGLIV